MDLVVKIGVLRWPVSMSGYSVILDLIGLMSGLIFRLMWCCKD